MRDEVKEQEREGWKLKGDLREGGEKEKRARSEKGQRRKRELKKVEEEGRYMYEGGKARNRVVTYSYKSS